MMRISVVIPFTFDILDALYESTRTLSLHPPNHQPAYFFGELSQQFNVTFQLTPTEYASFRTVLTLTADVYEMLDSLIKGNALMELTEPLNKIYRHTQNYKELWHFITHLGEHICKFDSQAVKERAPDTAYTNSRTPSG